MHAQVQVEVYADTQRDSLKKIVDMLGEQLNRSQAVKMVVRHPSAYRNSGVLIANISYGKYPVKPPTSLPSSGTEAFSVVANGQTVQILGNSDMAAGHGMFTWLESIGYRFYFANKDWHIIPGKLDLYAKQNVQSKPSFAHRRIFYGYGTGSPEADKDFAFWMQANKMGGSLNAIFGHAYDDIVARNTEVFKQHPEWFYPIPARGTLPANPKFDMSNEALVQFVIQDVLKRLESAAKAGSPLKMITMGPSDDVGTCNTPACQKLGSLTDRVYYLVNRVAKAIRPKFPNTMIGCLAYSEYIEPPNIKLEPNIYVSITTAFNNSKLSTVQLVDAWKKTGAMVGMYDYFSWFAWDQDVPGQSIASRVKELEKNIKRYYLKGAKGYDGESSIGWVSKGLGYYLTSRVMWNAGTETGPIKKEFFDLSFGKASDQMQSLWEEWANYGFSQPRESDIARWIDIAAKADQTEKNASVVKRLFQVKSYLYYLILLRNYQLDKSEKNLLTLLTYGYRKLDDGSIAGYAAFWELGNRSGIPGMAYAKDAKWRTNEPQVRPAELDNLLRSARSSLKIAASVTKYQPSMKLKSVTAGQLVSKLVADSAASLNNSFLLTNEWVMQLKSKSAANYIEIRGDFSKDLNNIKAIIISIYPYAPDGDVADLKPLLQFSYIGRNEKTRFSLGELAAGTYTILIEDPIKLYWIRFSDPVKYSALMRPMRQLQISSVNYAFIYVPEGVKRFNVIKSRTVRFLSPTGREVKMVNDRVEDLQVEVKPGEAGLWRILFATDRLFIEGIPPYMGLSPRQMLIPE